MKQKTKWTIDQETSEITFKVKHSVISAVKGVFKKFDASVFTSGNDFTSAKIDLWIDTSSLHTGDTKRDEHLKSIDFFNIKKYDRITFTGTKIGEADVNSDHALTGALTMLGITKTITLKVHFSGLVKDVWGNEKASFIVTGAINRSDWKLEWNIPINTGGLMINEEITLLCAVEFNCSTQNVLAPEPILHNKEGL